MKVRFLATITCFALFCSVNIAHAQTKKTSTTPVKKTASAQAKKNTSTIKAGTVKTKTATAVDSTSKVVKDTVAATKPIVAVAETTQKTQVVQTAQHVTTTQAPAQPVMPTASAPVFQNPFKKGTISFVNKTNVDYTYFKNMPNNNKTSDLSFAADINYFFLNNFAVGVDLRYTNYNTKSSPTSTYYYYMAYLKLTYGHAITPRVSVYGSIAGGLGHSKSGPNPVLPADYKDIYGTIAAPIALSTEGSLFLTPYFSYDYSKTKAANHDITDKGFSFGVRMESYLNGSNTKKTNQPVSPWPKKGVSFIEYNSSGGLGFSKRIEYQGTIRFGDVKKSNTSLSIGYHYYFLDFLAGGLNLSYTRTKSDNGSPDVHRTFSIQPTVTANAPVETSLKNLFLQVGYAISKGNYNGTKEDEGDLAVRLGYNVFLTKNISFSPKIGYQRNKYTHHTAGGDYKYTDSGLAVELGIRAWLNTTSWFKK